MQHATRRTLVLAIAGMAAPRPASAADFSYRGWRFDGSRVGPLPDALVRSYDAQIDILESLTIKPQIKYFFRRIPCVIDASTPGGPGAYSFEKTRMILSMTPQPKDNPVFLHELLHGYHDQKLGQANRTLLRHYQAAVAAQSFPPGSYMMSNPGEFFAMCASVTLWGRAARPPSTRENVKLKLPAVYAWIAEEFGLQVSA